MEASVQCQTSVQCQSSNVYPSQTWSPSIVRLSYVDNVLVLIRYHRISDIVVSWFKIHSIPLAFTLSRGNTELSVDVQYWQQIIAKICQLIQSFRRPVDMMADSEKDWFRTKGYHESDAIVDANMAEWILNVLLESPSVIFDDFFPSFVPNMKFYKRLSTIHIEWMLSTWANEEKAIHQHLLKIYSDFFSLFTSGAAGETVTKDVVQTATMLCAMKNDGEKKKLLD
jgi:hypothetical protein